MTGNVRVLLASEDNSKSGVLAESLESHGYAVARRSVVGAMEDALGVPGPEALIVHAGNSFSHYLTKIVPRLLSRPELRDVPILLHSDSKTRETVSDSGDTAGASQVSVSWHPRQMIARLEMAIRLDTMRKELARRAATAQVYGGPSPALRNVEEQYENSRILALCANGRLSARLSQTLGDKMEIVVEEAAPDALEKLADGVFDVVVAAVEPGQEPNLLDFVGDLRNNPRLFNTPVILVGARSSFSNLYALFAEGVDDLIFEPYRDAELADRVRHFNRQQRFRLGMANLYKTVPQPHMIDSLTGLYSHGVLHTHLAIQIKEAREAGHPITVGIFAIDGMHELNRTYGYAGGDQILRQIGTLINCLLRGEDFATRYSGSRICIALPDTTLSQAKIPLHRIAAVVANTGFAVAGLDQPVQVSMKVGYATLDADRDTPESLIERARKSLH